ncbi:MAG: glycosyltransferase [Alphaproteobacteria bacterium]
MFESRFTGDEIERAVAAFDRGEAPIDICRTLGISERTLYRWRRRLGGGPAVRASSPPETRTLSGDRIYDLVPGVAVLCARIADPVPLAQAKLRWDGELAPEPVVFSIVGDGDDGYRLLAIARVPAGAAPATAAIEVRTAAGGIVLSLPAVPRNPLLDGDGRPALDGLPGPVRQRLLRIVIETGGTWLRLLDDPAFVRLCRRLALAFAERPRVWSTCIALGGRLMLCAGAEGIPREDVRAVLLIGRRAVRRNAVLPQIRRVAGGSRMELVIDRPEALGPGRVLVLFLGGGAPELFMLDPDEADGAGTLLGLLQASGEDAFATRDYLLRCLRPYIGGNPQLQALIRESIALLPAAAPAAPAGGSLAGAIDLAVPAPGGGLFVRGWLSDGGRLVEGLDLISPFEAPRPIDPRRHCYARPPVEPRGRPPEGKAFVAWLAGASPALPEAPLRLRARLVSGSAVELPVVAPTVDPARARSELFGAVAPNAASDLMLSECLAPAIARIHRASFAGLPAPRVERFGPTRPSPEWSIVVPLYRSLEILPAQFASFAADPDVAAAEIVLVLDSPEQEDDLRRALHGLSMLYGLPTTLVVPVRNLGFAGAVNAGAAVARGTWLALCNSDVVPARPGWLSALRARFGPGVGAVGPLLLFPDDTIQHAGMYFDRGPDGRWLNRHFLKGWSRAVEAAAIAREVPAITGACMMIAADTFSRLGGLSTDFVVGDYEDSDLCLRLRDLGLATWFGADAVLYHLERHSIQHHPVYQRGLASRFNRWLHEQRWSEAMATLMADPARWGLPTQRDWRGFDAGPVPRPEPPSAVVVPMVA